MKKIVISFIIMSLFFSHCEKNNEQTKNILEELGPFGKWYLFDSEGGWTGSYNETNFNYLEISPIDEYKLLKDNEVLSEGKLIVTEQMDSTKVVFNYKSESGTSLGYYLKSENNILEIINEDTIRVYNTETDGYSYRFKKSNQEK